MPRESEQDRAVPSWAIGDPLMEWYATEIWGKRTEDDDGLSEIMCLQIFQAGLSWRMILARRNAFHRAFRGWRIGDVAALGPKAVDGLLQDTSIIRNRKKIEACIENAAIVQSIQREHGSFCNWFDDILDGDSLALLQSSPPPALQSQRTASLRSAVRSPIPASSTPSPWSSTGAMNFGLHFDGSDVGLGNFTVSAFAIISDNEILMSFSAPGTIPRIDGTVDDSDVVKFTGTSLGETTAGSFELYFDGSDVYLASGGEDIDAIQVLADGRLLISTNSSFNVGAISGKDEDLIAFTPASLGENTSGTWALYFDGGDVGLGNGEEGIDGAAVDAKGNIYLTSDRSFSVPGLAGEDEDVFVFTPLSLGDQTSGTYSPTLFFDGSLFGLKANDVNATDIP